MCFQNTTHHKRNKIMNNYFRCSFVCTQCTVSSSLLPFSSKAFVFIMAVGNFTFKTFICLIEKYGKSMENRSQISTEYSVRFNGMVNNLKSFSSMQYIHVQWLDHWWNCESSFWNAFVHKMKFSRKYQQKPFGNRNWVKDGSVKAGKCSVHSLF